jgi:hypothetical protein
MVTIIPTKIPMLPKIKESRNVSEINICFDFFLYRNTDVKTSHQDGIYNRYGAVLVHISRDHFFIAGKIFIFD